MKRRQERNGEKRNKRGEGLDRRKGKEEKEGGRIWEIKRRKETKGEKSNKRREGL